VAGEQWALVRLHGDPLGVLRLDTERAYSAADLGALISTRFAWPILAHLVEDGLAMGDVQSVGGAIGSLPQSCPQAAADTDWPSVTVAVCTRDRLEQLKTCLTALDAIDYRRDRLEILVVDNAPSNDATERFVRAQPGIRYVLEPRPGLDWARNRAVLEARGDIIAFTDDDVVVDARWVRALAAVFRDEPDAMCVTGLVLPYALDTRAQVLFEEYGGFGRGFNRVYATAGPRRQVALQHGGTGKFGTGANMAYRRSVFTATGLFDPALDVGTATNGGGDLEMFFRIICGGHLLVYEPRAIVRHQHREQYAQLRKQLTDHGIGFYAYLARSASAHPTERVAFIRLGLWWLWYWNVRRLIAALFGRSRFPMELIVAELRGSLLGVRRYSVARRQAAEILSKHGPQQPIAGAGS
jgi:glycosyltransferase involved in cell wall biosynthesis